MSEIGLVISKLELQTPEGVYEYRVRMPNRRVQYFNVRTANIHVGQKVSVSVTETDEGDKKYKIERIV